MNSFGFQTPGTAKIAILIDNHKVESVELNDESSKSTVAVTLPNDQKPHQLTIHLEDPTPLHWINLTLQQTSPTLKWINPKLRRSYYHLSDKQPLELYIDKPSWLRITLYDGKQHKFHYRFQKKPGNAIFTHQEFQTDYIRVAALKYDDNYKELIDNPIHYIDSVPTYWIQAMQANDRTSPIDPDGAATDDVSFTHLMNESFDIGHTFASPYLKWVNKPQSLSNQSFESNDTNTRERYFELGFNRFLRRQQDNGRIYLESSYFGRLQYGDNKNLIGSKQWFSWFPNKRHWYFNLFASGLFQFASDSGKRRASIYTRARFTGFMDICLATRFFPYDDKQNSRFSRHF